MVVKVWGRADHSKGFDDASDFVERTEFVAERAEEGEAALASRVLALFEGEVFSDDSRDVGSVVLHGTMARDVEQVPCDDHGFIDVDRFWNLGERKAEFDDAGFRKRHWGRLHTHG